ncbi:sterol desaturase family protein [Myxococcus sp. RHSTA-1-4]|uniref:sterol desaturase family protein n=1 Tax=Myxococcus sp. RHSTA-1-4 TaxID=2874601 RepID=UPI001CBBBD99|nr:sterol desaturase family protein [Myxococcus sp. RHSTA-1-4]MBZ4419254.1 sterol desaturase family protein [Myxococcus sp. RHSTA-1-4]
MTAQSIPERVRDFRDGYRAKYVGPRYSGRAHFAFTSLGSLAVMGFSLSRLEGVLPLEWLTVPAVFLLGNVVEFLGHRGPMHHRRRGLGLLFQRHTEQHHRFFTHEALAYESSRDVKMVLFPPVLLLFFLGAIATPLAALGFALVSPNVGWLFAASAVGYYLTYEWLHFCHHLPPEHPVARLPLMQRLRRHHQVHHDPSKMQRHNFNITFPLSDWLFGTAWRPGAESAGDQSGAPARHDGLDV